MTKQETIKMLRSIEDRAVDFPYMTACDWVAIAAAKRHLENSLETKEVDLEKEIKEQSDKYYGQCEKKLQEMDDNDNDLSFLSLDNFAKYFFELGLKAQKGEKV